jgi:hypothetical protein
MSSLSRKIKRKQKKDNEQEFKNKVGLFNKIPESCMTCDKPFDKKNKEMVMTWTVVVHRAEQKVNLYCPSCWNLAKKVIEEVENGYNNSKNNV